MDLYDLVAKSKFSLQAANPAALSKTRNYPQYGHKQKYTPDAEGSYNFQRQDGMVPFLDETAPPVSALDLEDKKASIANGGSGGPKNFPQYGHRHRYLPNQGDNYKTQIDAGTVATLDSTVFPITALDLENGRASVRNGGSGGPKNFPQYGHKHKYTPDPENTYNFLRADGMVPTLDETVPSITGLDIEDKRASVRNGGTGGPNNDYTTVYPSANVTGPLGAAPKNFTYQGIEYAYPKAPGEEPLGYYQYMKNNFAAR